MYMCVDSALVIRVLAGGLYMEGLIFGILR